MSNKASHHHKKAASHHEKAAEHHRQASRHQAAGNPHKAAHHAQAARGHALHASDYANDISKEHAMQPGREENEWDDEDQASSYQGRDQRYGGNNDEGYSRYSMYSHDEDEGSEPAGRGRSSSSEKSGRINPSASGGRSHSSSNGRRKAA